MKPNLITAMKPYLHEIGPHHCLLLLPAASMARQTGTLLYIELLIMWLKRFAFGDTKEARRLYAL